MNYRTIGEGENEESYHSGEGKERLVVKGERRLGKVIMHEL